MAREPAVARNRLSKTNTSSAELLALKNVSKEPNKNLKSGSRSATSKAVVQSELPDALRGGTSRDAEFIGAQLALQKISENIANTSNSPRSKMASLRGTLRGRQGSLKVLFGGRAAGKENMAPVEMN